MINSFTSLVARHILNNAGVDLKDLAVVFPNRRSGAFFRRDLARQIEKPSWTPGIFSIDDWLISLSGLEKSDHLVELALLFEIVKKEVPSIGLLSDFIDLGETMLSDFDDADKYLVDPIKLFATLNESKKIDSQFDITNDEELVERIRIFWSTFGLGRSSHQEKWLELWDKLYLIYRQFQKSLKDIGLGTSGMCYRNTAEGFIDGTISCGRFKRVAFVGFNILTPAEETVFQTLRDKGIASFYWDYHPHYLKGPQEAGKFIQQHIRSFPSPAGFQPFPDGTPDFFRSTDSAANISVVPVTSNTGQIQALLNDIIGHPESNRGIVLSDECLFSDLLSSWPDDNLPVNFTSGYPFRDTQAAGFFNNLISIYLDLTQSTDNQYCKPELILSFLRHPWTRWLTGQDTNSVIQLIKRRFPDSVPAGFINWEPLLSPWFGTLSGATDILIWLKEISSHLLTFESRYGKIEKAAVLSISSQISSFREIIIRFNLGHDGKSLSRFLLQFINSFKISLETDRDACNQVTGILETRLIDFDEVFILSFNEGIWPSKSLPGSFIPYSIRKIFNLPTAENRDAMYAYYFYRLIQRTKQVHIYYLTGHRDDVIRSGEKSRYITQLQYEFPERVAIKLEPPARVGATPEPIIIKKEGIVKERLDRFLAGSQDNRSLSPSAINEYMDCSLRFALKRIFDIAEPEEIAFASEPRGLGILIHQVMSRLYKEFVGKENGPDDKWIHGVLGNQDRLSEIIIEVYRMILNAREPVKPGGKDILGIEVVRQYLSRILEFDRLNLPTRILGLEERFRMVYPLDLSGQSASVSLNGIIDRIDRVPEGLRIVDYKTGNCDLNARTFDDIFSRDSSKRPKEIFQVMMYCEFFLNRNSGAADIFPCLFRLGRFRADDFEHRIKIAGKDFFFRDFRDQFNAGLKNILDELFNQDVPFFQTEDEQVCRYCPFTGICGRENYS